MKKKRLALAIVTIAVSLIACLCIVKAEDNPTVQEFTVRYVENPYDVAPKPSSTINPYTGVTMNTTIAGYHVENKSVEVVIKNPPNASYYNLRYKGHFEDKWRYYPFNPDSGIGYMVADSFSVPYQASNTTYTVLPLHVHLDSIPAGGQIDVQVQALYGYFRAVPYVHVQWVGGDTYDFYFNGTKSGWSDTQTVTIPGASPPPSPSTATSSPSTIPTITPSSTTELTPTPTASATSSPSAITPTASSSFAALQQTEQKPPETNYLPYVFGAVAVAMIALVSGILVTKSGRKKNKAN